MLLPGARLARARRPSLASARPPAARPGTFVVIFSSQRGVPPRRRRPRGRGSRRSAAGRGDAATRARGSACACRCRAHGDRRRPLAPLGRHLQAVLHLLHVGPLGFHGHAQEPVVPLAVDVVQVRLRIRQAAVAHAAVEASLLSKIPPQGHHLLPPDCPANVHDHVPSSRVREAA